MKWTCSQCKDKFPFSVTPYRALPLLKFCSMQCYEAYFKNQLAAKLRKLI